jgi:hypothetical protein
MTAADALMVGHVYRFRERVGGGLSAESPASVAFDIYLVDYRHLSQLTKGAFYEDKVGHIHFFYHRMFGSRARAGTGFHHFPQPGAEPGAAGQRQGRLPELG